jgi:hypothetical protein
MTVENETADHEPDEPSLRKMAWANGLILKFGPFGNPVTDFRQCFVDFVGGLRAEWSREKASVQFLGYNDTRGFLLFACSDDEKTMDIVIDDMPEMVELVIRDMGATLYFFFVTGEVAGHPEVLMVGGATIEGEHIMGWLEITRDSEGNERLGRWNSFTFNDKEYLEFSSSWLMRLLETRPVFH